MVMICENVGFVQGVKYLKVYKKTIADGRRTGSPEKLGEIPACLIKKP
jgi:hypothetical protein